MFARLKFLLNRTSEHLWVRPLATCVVSIAGALLAKAADRTTLADFTPAVTFESNETLLTIMAGSMLVIATFAVASMVSAHASASSTATPRTFSLVVSDDVSQNALSTFIGAFIFSLVSLIAVLNGFYGEAGRFALFVLTAMTFAGVVVTLAIAKAFLIGDARVFDDDPRFGLIVLSEIASRAPARLHSRLALARAEHAMTLEEDRDEIRRLAARVGR